VGLLLSVGSNSNAAAVILEWDANTESDLAGYKIHWGTESGTYTDSTDVGNVTTVILSIPPGSYIAATAYSDEGLESGYSNEVFYYFPPASPTGGVIDVRHIVIEPDDWVDDWSEWLDTEWDYWGE
jgi:hypothetical protein